MLLEEFQKERMTSPALIVTIDVRVILKWKIPSQYSPRIKVADLHLKIMYNHCFDCTSQVFV